mmetsp:Transcript_26709/g.26591  ORF Transcript_26709/g.26591 Transcript_26709/m.26591 type:complete len:190 (+) Transcript_26709:2-571(+)
MFFVFGSYCYSNILKNEFIANYNNKNTLKKQKKVLNCLPEGVLIADKHGEYKYVNPKIKDTFSILEFYETEGTKAMLSVPQERITRKIDKIIHDVCSEAPSLQKNDNGSISEELNNILKNFTVSCKRDDLKAKEWNKSDDFGRFNEHRGNLLIPIQDNKMDIELSLEEFLNTERQSLLQDIRDSKETKV